MTDIASVIIAGDPTLATWADWAMSGPDLQSDSGLETAVIISLLTDRQAEGDDLIPDATRPATSGTIANRRGWWGDSMPEQTTDAAKPDRIGSRLWLLERAQATQQTATLAKKYIEEALQWLIDDGVAQVVSVATKWKSQDVGTGNLAIGIVIARTGPNGVPVNHQYDFVWYTTLGAYGTVAQTTLPSQLITDSGIDITDDTGQPIDVN